MEPFAINVGIDWGSEEHAVCVQNGSGTVIREWRIAHSGEGHQQLLNWVLKLSEGDPSRVAVALEVPRGSLVEMFIEKGIAVFFLNPKQLDRFRDRHTVAGAKDDRRDAFVLADALRTDLDKFTRCRLDHPLIVRLREITRAEEEVEKEFRRTANQLWHQLWRFYPQLLSLSHAVDEAWIWALWELYPTPEQASAARPGRVKKILYDHRIRRVSAEEVCAAIKAPALPVAPGVTEAASSHVELLVPRLRLLADQQKTCKRKIEALLDQLTHDTRDGPNVNVAVLRTLPGVGTKNGAVLLSEAAQLLADRDLETLRAKAGIAPVTRQSGKSRTVTMRHACDGPLRNAMYHIARIAVQQDQVCSNYYWVHRESGQKHGRALRSLADRQLRVLFAMLATGTPYQPRIPISNAT